MKLYRKYPGPLFLFVLLLFSAPAAGQFAEALTVVMDAASYRLVPESDTCYTEFYYGVWRDKLTFRQSASDSLWEAEFEVHLQLSDSLGNAFLSDKRTLATRVASEAEARRGDITIFDVISAVLPPGLYGSKLTVTDLASGKQGSAEDSVRVPRLGHSDGLALSDIELAYGIRFVSDTLISAKVKNGYYIEPNPSGLFAPEDSVLYYYAELYNLPAEPGSFRVQMWIVNDVGDIVKQLPPKFAPRLGESALLTYGVLVADLPPGRKYQLAVEVDHGENAVAARKPFWLGSGAAAPVTEEQETFTEEDALFNEHFLVHIATVDEMREYRVLSLEGKRKFLYEFWRQHDPDPSTAQNEFYQEHARRFAIANDRFSRSLTQRDDGWNTDQGRIFIRHGPPDDIIYASSSIGSLPWERWEYLQLEGGVYYIFLDENNLGIYRLVHSNKQGELQDPDWELKIEREGLDIINR